VPLRLTLPYNSAPQNPGEGKESKEGKDRDKKEGKGVETENEEEGGEGKRARNTCRIPP